MRKQYQVTLTSEHYKPVSCIITREQKTDTNLLENAETKKQIIAEGTIKICQKRLWSKSDLKKYGYLKVRVRQYDKEEIKQLNAERYEKIKAEKYASGEWKKPKYLEEKG